MKFSAFYAALAIFAGAFAATSANAATTVIEIVGTSGPATVSCTDTTDPVCKGIVDGSIILDGNMVDGGSAGTLSSTEADLYTIGSNSEANEAAALNVLAGESFTGSDGTRTDTGGADSFSFMSFAEWIVIKIGDGTFFIKNFVGQEIDVLYDKNGSTAGGISHITQFGVVPLPAALTLLLTALGGLGFLGWRRRRREMVAA